MNTGYYMIGEVSKITGISKDTLHFYNKIGLLVPDYIDERNKYRYYSSFNLWQLDIITMCRNLNISIEKIKEILLLKDNMKITKILLEYREEALRLSEYYKQVAADILWYGEENECISKYECSQIVELKELKEEKVIAGVLKRDESSYHANLQEASKEVMLKSKSIRRKYGYIIDIDQVKNNKFYKCREYIKVYDKNVSILNNKNIYTLPAGEYAVFIIHVSMDKADFTPLFRWMKEHQEYSIDVIYAEELGLQLFDYSNDYYCEIKAHLIRNNGI